MAAHAAESERTADLCLPVTQGDIIDDRYTVADKIEMLMGQLQPGESLRFETLFASSTTKAEVIVTFLAVLALMKLNQFVVRQSELLGDIVIERRTISAVNAIQAADAGAIEE